MKTKYKVLVTKEIKEDTSKINLKQGQVRHDLEGLFTEVLILNLIAEGIIVEVKAETVKPTKAIEEVATEPKKGRGRKNSKKQDSESKS